MILAYILFFTFLGSIVSLLGGVMLLLKEKFAIKISHFLAAFAAGTLLGTAFLDLLPESLEGGKEIDIFWWTLIGILAFFLLERFIHHHHDDPENKNVVSLIVVGDSIHNFIDGVAIAATFLISIPLGIVTSLAVAAHEIPQEIADFGLMLHKGVKRNKVLKINFLSALFAMVGAILTFFARDQIEGMLPIFLALTAGFFIYIAASDLIPEIHNEDKRVVALTETLLLLLGVLVIWLAVNSLSWLNLPH